MTQTNLTDEALIRQIEAKDEAVWQRINHSLEDRVKEEEVAQALYCSRKAAIYLPQRCSDADKRTFSYLFPEYSNKEYGGSSVIAANYSVNLGAFVTRSLLDACNVVNSSVVVYGGYYLCDILSGTADTHHCFDVTHPTDILRLRTTTMEVMNVVTAPGMRVISRLAGLKYLVDYAGISKEKQARALTVLKATLPVEKVVNEGRLQLSMRDRRENALRDAISRATTFDCLMQSISDEQFKALGIRTVKVPTHCSSMGTCTHEAEYMIVNHNETIMSVYQAAAAMIQHNTRKMYGSFYFDPAMFEGNRGHLELLRMTWSIKGGDILIHIDGDCKSFMCYDYQEYMLFGLVTFFEYGGFYFQREIFSNPNGIWQYVMHKLEHVPDHLGRHAHRIYVPSRENSRKVVTFRQLNNNAHRYDIRKYEKIEVIAPAELVDNVLAYAQAADNLKYENVYKMLYHRNQRTVIDYKTAKTPERQIGADDLAAVAIGIYAHAYCARWSDSQVIAAIKRKNPDYNPNSHSRSLLKWILRVAVYYTTLFPVTVESKIQDVYREIVKSRQIDAYVDSNVETSIAVENIGVKISYGKECVIQTYPFMRKFFRSGKPGYMDDAQMKKYTWGKVVEAFYALPVDIPTRMRQLGVTMTQFQQMLDMYGERDLFDVCKCGSADSYAKRWLLKYDKVTHDVCGMGLVPRCSEIAVTESSADSWDFDEQEDSNIVDTVIDLLASVRNRLSSKVVESVYEKNLPTGSIVTGDVDLEAPYEEFEKVEKSYVSAGARKMAADIALVNDAMANTVVVDTFQTTLSQIDPDVLALDAAAAPKTAYISDAVGVLVHQLSKVRPVMMASDPSQDQSLGYYNSVDLKIETQQMDLDLGAREPLKPQMRLTLAASLPNLRVRQPDQTGVLAALMSRNLAVENFAADQDDLKFLQSIFENWADAMLVPTWREDLKRYFENKLVISSEDIEKRLCLLTDEEIASLNDDTDEFDVFVRTLNNYKGMIKTQVKPKIDNSVCTEVANPQIIVYDGKESTIPASAVFQELQKRIMSLLKPNVCWMTGKNRTELNSFLATFTKEFGKWVESDFSKFDKNQQFRALRCEYFVYYMFGLDTEFLHKWIKSNLKSTISTTVGIRIVLIFQRRSGTSTTLLGNNVVTSLAVANVFDCRDAILIIIMGDDFVMKTEKEVDLTRCDEQFLLLFGLTAKSFVNKCGYFASMYIVESPRIQFPMFMSDPLKRPFAFRDLAVDTKFSRRGGAPVHTFNLEERYESYKDIMLGYERSDMIEALAEVVAERSLPQYVGATGDLVLLNKALATLAVDFNEFSRLYNERPELVEY